jgi:hypothetical protein
MLQKAWTGAGTQKMLVRLHAAIILGNRAIGVRRYAGYQTLDIPFWQSLKAMSLP